jgi:hypothetical protein
MELTTEQKMGLLQTAFQIEAQKSIAGAEKGEAPKPVDIEQVTKTFNSLKALVTE